MVRVKICGITSVKDALAAESAGADALGFVFAKSPRRVSASRVRSIVKNLGPWIATVGVFVNERPEVILSTAKICGLSAVQLHGEETQAYVSRLRAKGLVVIQAFRIKTAKDLAFARRSKADAILMDSAVRGVRGGTGRIFDWALLKKCKTKLPVIISGGLNAKNLHELLREYAPYGVDVSSGVESGPGVKNTEKVRKFIRRAKSSNS